MGASEKYRYTKAGGDRRRMYVGEIEESSGGLANVQFSVAVYHNLVV